MTTASRKLLGSRKRTAAEAGWRCGVRLGRHRNEADCLSLPSGAGRGLITPLSPYSSPFPQGLVRQGGLDERGDRPRKF